ncbi:MAG: Rieske (2Fe-2S) protein [Desulfofustis sp. PB-SRB1]|jgi:cytochrome b6-f complex iron-sulfur subunit|nr:Rieske (2Fe-2S) protein [Desulfofustis sp. PB-SRB1]MBM1001094.1 Rieske (2Fe-2S) protein [Desulfofustis sp. PB-SRB1]HBH30181.1 Rieske (2Fe-2S) protein [Desulfofustis sp.]HBH30784.1 Rieske (2Fe-2S) protein [Desulfofustis sp.]
MTPPEKEVVDHTITNHGRRNLFTYLWRLLAVIFCIELLWAATSLISRRGKKRQQADGGAQLIYAGAAADMSPGDVKAVPAGKFYLACLEDGGFMALSKTCTHLGCSLPWNREEQRFTCPCHGSTFDIRGSVMTPPAILPLDIYPVRVENGRIMVDVSQPRKRDSFQASQVAYR